MRLTHLSLANFRSFARLDLDIPARVSVFQGENAQGKTNLLEAVFYLATTKSPLASSDRELIRWAAIDDVIPHAAIDGTVARGDDQFQISITLVGENAADAAPQSPRDPLKKQIRLNGVPRRAMDVVGQLKAVAFLPEDIDIVTGPPSGRRRYLDMTLCQIDADYCRSLSRYKRVVTQRNALLRRIREGEAGETELAYWDEQIAELGGQVLCRRHSAISHLDEDARPLLSVLTSGSEQLTLIHSSTVLERLYAQNGHVPDDASQEWQAAARWTAALLQALSLARSEEIARGVTVIGPHRDDVRFLLDGIDATVYASRGQQRTVALALKLAEVRLMKREGGETPVLLLDDVLSELDERRSLLLLEAIAKAEQVLVTTTHLRDFTQEFLQEATLWRVASGQVSSLNQSSTKPEAPAR